MTNSVLSRSPSQIATSSIASNTIRSGVEMAKGDPQTSSVDKTDSQNTVQNGSPKPNGSIDLLKPPTPPKTPEEKAKLNGGAETLNKSPGQKGTSGLAATPTQNGHAQQKPATAAAALKTSWHVNPKDDVEVRRIIIKKIVQLLDGCRPKAFAGQPKKLMNLARRLEVALYKASRSKEEYMDLNTLRSRVVNLVKQSNAAQGNGNSPRANKGANGNASGRSSTDQQRLELLRQRQQRLLLLRHASQCPVKAEDKCKITPHCAAMKKLWQHISKCKDERCTVQHCVSSRFVLSHYHRCKEPKCPVCKPVRLISQKRPRDESNTSKSPSKPAQPNVHKRQKVEKQAEPQRPIVRRVGSSQGLHSLKVRERMLVKKPSVKIRGMALRINPRFARSCKSGTGPSLPLSLTKSALLAHLKALKVERLQACLAPLLRKLMESKHNRGVFNEPVDPVALNIPEYTTLITEPMDLGTIRQKLEDGKYCKLQEFEREVKLTFNNAIKFNPPEHPINQLAQILLKTYESDLPRVLAKMKKDIKRRHDKCQLCFQNQCEVCPLCERGCIAFEPKIIYCSGPCANRIGRNSNFYAVPGSSYYWCTDCFDKAKKDTVESNGRVYKKADMEKKRNNELFAEPWVSCDRCNSWVHQVCALFNMRKNNPNSNTSYTCPACLVACAKDPPPGIKDGPKPLQNQNNHGIKREQQLPAKVGGIPESITLPLDKHVPDASDLEHTRLGLFLETWVRERYGSARQDLINNPPTIQGDVGPDPSKLHIRVLSNFEENCKVKPFVKKAMESYPDAFKFRSRCLFLFQELDGVNVLIYAMFVQEYGSDCPDPNKRKLYIAYLDSVHYFRPRKLRTLVYHELLLAYLEYSRRSGFTSAYIWACPPPNKRDDYIIHCHPEHQRVPSADRLRKWYHDMITRGCENKIILGHCSLFEEHFESSGNSSANSKRSKKSKKKEKKKGKKGKKKSSKKAAASRGTSMTPPLEEEKDKEEELLESLPVLPGGPKTETKKSTSKDSDSFSRVGRGLLTSDGRNRPTDLEARKKIRLAKLGNLPYFEGDYWPQEAEELGKEQEAKLRAQREKAESSRTGRKRQRMEKDTEAKPKPETEEKPQELDVKAAKELLIVRLAEQLEAMKDDFLVVKLAHECTRCGKYLLRGRWECRHKDCSQSSSTSCVFALCNDCYVREQDRPVEQQHGGGCFGDGSEFQPKLEEDEAKKEKGEDQSLPADAIKPLKEDVKKSPEKTDDSKTKEEDKKEDEKDEATKCSEKSKEEKTTKRSLESEETKQGVNKKLKSETGEAVAKPSDSAPSVSAKEKAAAEEAKKKAEEARRKKELEAKVAQWRKVPLGCTRKAAETTDDHILHYVDENLPVNTPRFDKLYKNQLVETRHSFLSLCSGNKYQFDQLRRAKHSTMMVLYHLHNPDAPAHLYTCNECRADILGGKRFHCDICQSGNFDLCERCVTRVKHIHRLTAFVVTGGVNTSGPEAKRMKQRVTEMRRARKHSLHLFLEALVHASSCDDRDCDTAPCRKMKDLLKHRLNCQVRVRGGCEVCRRVLCLVQMHARNCRLPNCRVPHCDDLKAHLAQQQMLHARQVARRESLQGRSRGRIRARGTARRGRGRVNMPQQSMKATVVAGSGGTRLKIKATVDPNAKKTRGGRVNRGGRASRSRGR